MSTSHGSVDAPVYDGRTRVVMLAGGGDSTNVLFHALAERFEVPGVIVERPVSRARLLRRRRRQVGTLRAIDQALFAVLLAPLLRRAARRRIGELRTRSHAGDPIPAERRIDVPSVNSGAAAEALRRLAPTVVVVCGTRIIRADVLGSVPAPFINLHAGITPRYRGSHGGYWALVEGRPDSAGATVHLVDAGIDTGGIVGQARIAPTPADSVVTYPLLQLEAALPLLVEAIGTVGGGSPLVTIPSIDPSTSKLWFHPGAIAYVVRRRLHRIR